MEKLFAYYLSIKAFYSFTVLKHNRYPVAFETLAVFTSSVTSAARLTAERKTFGPSDEIMRDFYADGSEAELRLCFL
ncbi:hypothetical protein SRHO_G00292250 [Serrasalmus rhombeus]